MGTLRLLEAIRFLGMERKTRFYQASTSELYGLVQETPQKETTPFYPRSPYAVAKLYAYWITVNYREAYGMYACNGILFNHESPRRGETFVTRKITRGLANIAQGLESCLYLGNMDALRDWGHARDYVRMQWLMLQQDTPEDFVIATGVQYSVRQFVVLSAKELGITLEFKGNGIDETGVVVAVEGDNAPSVKVGDILVSVDEKYFRPAEVETLLGDPSNSREKLGWVPEITFQEMVAEMVKHALIAQSVMPCLNCMVMMSLCHWNDKYIILNKKSLIYVAGHRGMVGTAIVQQLEKQGYTNLITRTHAELDLCDQVAVRKFFTNNKIDGVYLAAARVGGIHANNTYPAEFIYQNIMIEANVVHEAWISGVKHLLFLGSSCIYPRLTKQPMKEDALLTGTLEPTNEPYAIAKIAGIKLCESYNRQYDVDYRSVMPTSLYGPHDNFHPENSHVIPAMLNRFHEAAVNDDESVVVWGSGKPLREFLHVTDMATASIHVMNLDKTLYEKNTAPMLSHINVGTGVDCTIHELAETIARVIGYKGQLIFDDSKLDGAPRKLMDVSRLRALGWVASVSLEDGLKSTYRWFLDHQKSIRG